MSSSSGPLIPVHSAGLTGIFSTGADADAAAVHRVFSRCLRELEEALLGNVLPDPFFVQWLNPRLDELFQCLCDPNLPLLELEVRRSYGMVWKSKRAH